MKDNLHLCYNYLVKEGDKVIKKSRKIKSKSFLVGFARALYSYYGSCYSVHKSSNGTTTHTGFVGETINLVGDSNIIYRGITVGTGTAAVDINDYCLTTLIASGTAATQLVYNETVLAKPASDASGATMRLSRTFSNQSGGNISVEETGVIGSTSIYGSYNQTLYLYMIRDLTGGISVDDGQTLTLNYDFETVL